MQDSLDLVLMHCAASYNTANEAQANQETVQAVIRQAKAPKAKLQVVKEETASKPKVHVMIPVPEKGTHDARSFMIAIRRSKTREESIQAIAGYVGYNSNKEYGLQEDAARAQAQRELKAVHPAPDSGFRNVKPTVAGFVAGMPDHNAKHLMDLHARERLANEAIDEHTSLAKEALSDSERSYQESLVKLEKERLYSIRTDIKNCMR